MNHEWAGVTGVIHEHENLGHLPPQDKTASGRHLAGDLPLK
jgi:hypothetical protein